MKRIILLLEIALVGAILIACASKVAPVAPLKEKPLEVVAPVAKADWEMKWERALEGARKEGTVVVYGAAGPIDRDILIKGMRDNFDIKAEILGLKTEQLVARVNSERRAGIFYSDVYIQAPVTAITGLKPESYLEKLDDTLVLPEVVDPKLWYEGKLPFVDRDHTILSFTVYPNESVFINTNMVKNEEIQSFFDLLEPKWKGKIMMPDPTFAGAMQTIVAMVGLNINWDYWKSFIKQEPVIVRDQRLMGDWLAHGKYPICFALSGTYMELRQVGAPILGLDMREGGRLTAGSGALSLFKNAPHPNAARVLINWLLSREGQNTWTKAKETQSARVDVPTYLFGGKGREPGQVYFDETREEYLLRRHEYTAKAKEIFGPLLK